MMFDVAVLLRRLSQFSLALIVASLAAGILLPVYTDEVGWRFQERAGFDGVDKLYTDSCGPGTIVRPPFFMMPARWYSAVFNGAFPDPLAIRLSGILYAICWIGMLVVLIRRVAPEPMRRDALTIVAVTLMGIGVMPLLLVWSRPEQPILLGITGALLIAFGKRGDGAASIIGNRGDWLRAAGVLACALVALSYHFKALLLIPAFAACLWLAARKALAPRLLLLTLLGAGAIVAARYWFGRLDCRDDPVLAAQHAAQSLGLRIARQGGNPPRAARIVLGNLDLGAYVRLAAPAEIPMSQWVPPGLVNHATQKLRHKALVFTWAAALLLALRGVAATVQRSITARLLDARLIVALLLFAAVAAWSASQVIRTSTRRASCCPC